MSKLTNKIIVVTGGSGLIGSALLTHLRAEGAIGINAEIKIVTDLEKNAIACDITNEQSVQQAIDLIVQKYKKIDGWVNCAYPRTADWGNNFENISASSWKQNVDMQLNSVFTCCQLISKQMKLQKNGNIVNLSSIYGVVGPDFGVYEGTGMTMPAAYAAIKGGIVNFTRYLASYLGADGIRVNCVSPGGIFDNQNELFVKQYEQRVPMKRMGKPGDIVPAISFLLSDEASYITGHNLVIDGGWTAI
jgi:NAD(P)-dependent dehydrogenase (short-subunit alcohol dehydrogenase family)